MSAFQVSEAHINYLVNAIQRANPTGGIYAARDFQADPNGLGRLLAQANADSVNARYAHHHRPCEPIPYRWSMRLAVPVSPVQTIKACDCFRYQSCEHDGWADSLAAKIIDQLREHAINQLPGYDDAAWDIDAA